MDIKSASPSTGDAERKSSNVSHSSTGASQVTSPMHGSTNSQGTAAVTVPIVQSPLGDPSLQPSALVFRSGIAFDYDNFPKILSLCWPVFNNQSGMSVVARDGPERGVPQIATNEIITTNNHVTVEGAPPFTWDPPCNEPKAEDPVISTPDKKAPIGITVCNPCEVRTETVTGNVANCVKSTTVPQQNTSSVPPLGVYQSQTQGACYGPTERATVTNVEISSDKYPKETSFDQVQRFESEGANVGKVLGRKRSRKQQLNTRSSFLEARGIICPVHHNMENSNHKCCSTVSKERLGGRDCERDTVATSRESRNWLSSTENNQVEKSKTDCIQTAKISPMAASSKVKTTDDAPIATEDKTNSVANVIDLKEESYVFSFSPPRQSDSDSNHPTRNIQQSNLESKNDKQEDVWDLITRIRYIKSRLHRAESDYRKKRMLKMIVGLQKRVKALVKGMRKEKERGLANRQQETSSRSGALLSKEFAQNNNETDLGSQVTDAADKELETNDAIMNKGVMTLLPNANQPSKDSSKDTTERKCEGQDNCEELPAESPSAFIVNDSNDVPSSETNTADELTATTLSNSKGGDITGNNNNSQMTYSNGVDDLSLRLPNGIALDCSPCGKRVAFSPDADESGLQKSHSTPAKRMKALSLSHEVVSDTTGTRLDVTHHARNVTQDGAMEGLAANERNRDSNNVKPDEKNVSRYEISDFLFRKEFILSDTEDDMQLNSTDEALEINVENNREAPLTILGDQVQQGGEGKARQANEGTGKDRSTVFGEINSIDIDGASILTCSNNKGNGDVEMDKIQSECTQNSENNPCSEETQSIAFNLRPVEDNSSEYEEEHCSSLLEGVLQDEETQCFTSPAIHNPSGRQEDVDLLQSLQIREARILKLTQKRDKLLNLTGFKLK
ncbi:hypothetical protein ACROYT_G028248 [Oculina patagonica]